jgi:hypothetical protein
MTENDLKELGWELVKQFKFNSDKWKLNRYQLGCMSIEFVYKDGELVACELTITELNNMPINLTQAKTLTELLKHHTP